MAHATILALIKNKELTFTNSTVQKVKQEGRKETSPSQTPFYRMTVEVQCMYLQGRTTKEPGWVHKRADDKGRNAGEGVACSGKHVPACVKARLSFLGVPEQKKKVLPITETLLCCVRRDWLEIFHSFDPNFCQRVWCPSLFLTLLQSCSTTAVEGFVTPC
jgi:hypothetical protein